jgi:hypothetical protein
MNDEWKSLGTIEFADASRSVDPLIREMYHLMKILRKFSREALKRGVSISSVVSAHLNVIVEVDEMAQREGYASALPEVLRKLADMIESGELRLRRDPPAGRA